MLASVAVAAEHISARLLVTGDIKGEYDFSGPLGATITASSTADTTTPESCLISALFRRLKYRGQNSVEVWLTFECMFKGQKNIYKTHRIYLKPVNTSQKIKLPMLAKNLKNIQLEFQEISLKLGK